MIHPTRIPCRWFLLFVLPLLLTGCPEKVGPMPDPPKPDTQTLSISLFSPFSQVGDGNWTGEIPAEGLSSTILVSSSADWTASSSVSWCTVSPASGNSKTTQISLTIGMNDSENSRSGEIVVRSGSLSVSVKLTQKKLEPISVSPTEVEMDAAGGSFKVTVTCPIGYKLSSMPDWVTEVGKASNKVHSFKVGPNPEYEVRSGVLVFCDDKSVCVPVAVRQKAREGTPATVDWTKEFYRRSLYMDFTGTWCGFCPRMARALSRLESTYPDKIVGVEIHDSGSILHFQGCASLQNLYNIHSFPKGVIDCRKIVNNGGNVESTFKGIEEAYLESASKIKAVSAIGWTSSLSGNDLSLAIDLFLKKAGDYKVTVVVMESGLVTSQSDYDNETNQHLTSYLHHDAARIAVTDIQGSPFSVSSDQTVKSFFYTVSIPQSYKKENLKVLVYVHRAYSSTVKKINDSDFDGYYVDNCAAAPVGATVLPALVGGAGGSNEDFSNGTPINW